MDEIKRRLRQIEAQLHARSLHHHLVATAPLFFLAIGLIVGIVTQHALSHARTGAHRPLLLYAWSLLVLFCVLAVCIVLARARQNPRPRLLAWAALLCFAGLGGIRLIAFETAGPNDIRHLVGNERTLATLRGRLRTAPRAQRRDWCFARFAFTDPATAFYLRITEVKTDQGWTKVAGTVRVQVSEPAPNLTVGDAIQAHCWLYRFEGPTNPGQFDMAAYLQRHNVYLGASVPTRTAIQIRKAAPRKPLRRLPTTFAKAAAHALFPDAPPDEPGAGLLQALLLGERANIDPETYEAFRRTGLLHFISLSGLHLGIFVGTVWWSCKTAGLLKPARAVVCIVLTAAFLLVVPPRAPTIRAAIIVWAFCASVLLRRRANLLNALCLAVIVLLLIRPTQLFEAGWQLSFTAVAAIVALTPRIESLILDQTPPWFRSRQRSGPLLVHLARRTAQSGIQLLSVGIAAWIGGAGILLYHFGAITLLTSLWTVLIFPLVWILLIIGFLKIPLFYVLPTLSRLLGSLATFGADLLIWIVNLLAKPGINHILIGRVTLWAIALYYALVLFATFAPTRRPLLKKRLCIALAIALIAYVGVLKWQRTRRDHLTLTCLDVGHGQAILVQLPGSKNILFDAGSLNRSNVGARTVLPFLDAIGIDRLHAIVISHGDIDHLNGIPEIVERRRVDHIYANDAFLARSQTRGTGKRLIEHLRECGRTIERIPATIQASKATVETLWPSDEMPLSDEIGDNDASLVARITFADVSILLCSDIEQFAQQQIMALYPDLTAQIVVAPHHGSTSTLDEDFLPGLSPEILLVSRGRPRAGQRSTAPAPESSATLMATSTNGALTVCVQAGGVVERATYVHASAGD